VADAGDRPGWPPVQFRDPGTLGLWLMASPLPTMTGPGQSSSIAWHCRSGEQMRRLAPSAGRPNPGAPWAPGTSCGDT
jgi:hypothetical protein